MRIIKVGLLLVLYAANIFAQDQQERKSVRNMGPIYFSSRIDKESYQYVATAIVPKELYLRGELSMIDIAEMAHSMITDLPYLSHCNEFYYLNAESNVYKITITVMDKFFYELQ